MALLDKFKLDGKVAIVTGAGKGIGAAIARAFAEAGADVAIGARTEADLEAVAADIASLGRRALTVPTDVMDYAQLQALADKTMAEWTTLFESKDFKQFGCQEEWSQLSDQAMTDIYTYMHDHAADSPTPAKCK